MTPFAGGKWVGTSRKVGKEEKEAELWTQERELDDDNMWIWKIENNGEYALTAAILQYQGKRPEISRWPQVSEELQGSQGGSTWKEKLKREVIKKKGSLLPAGCSHKIKGDQEDQSEKSPEKIKETKVIREN